ncbi:MULTISPECIES: OmpA/MotB family protein [Clostridium]|uniref:OmpA/MotB family protein n=1 Tax=Clostridium TaxID=1485 RepID=UPI00069D1EB2|nr:MULTISPECIES: flagellar motor protein MotB [Clostridium]KOF57436.1 chemotaxis protein MotB [Clostridium sp. DMHC 10]MCD2348380.1 flagellar motor protein MotB [Clostridium guangxiense]
MRKKKAEQPENAERWLLTYSDLITLLMAFFIVMYASSTADKVKMAKVSASIRSAFGASGKSVIGEDSSINLKQNDKLQEAEKDAAISTGDAQRAEENKLKEVKQKVDTYVKQNGLTGSISTNLQERGLVIRIVDTMMFDTAKADVKLDAQNRLVEIGKILKGINNIIRIEGHTDSRPMHDQYFQSNVELSAARAANVWHVLEDKAGVPHNQLIASAYAENDPVAVNDNEADMAKNRRVDIVVINSKYNSVESNQNNK